MGALRPLRRRPEKQPARREKQRKDDYMTDYQTRIASPHALLSTTRRGKLAIWFRPHLAGTKNLRKQTLNIRLETRLWVD
jgi:hypothetical protein